MANLAARMLLP